MENDPNPEDGEKADAAAKKDRPAHEPPDILALYMGPIIEERMEIEDLLETAKKKFQEHNIDEKLYTSITMEYKKKLIELDATIARLQKTYGTPLSPEERIISIQKAQQNLTEYPHSMKTIKEKIRERTAEMTDNTILLISSKSENHTFVVSGMLDVLINQRGMAGVYISVSRPHETILATMESSGIPSENIYFIDCISQMTGKIQATKSKNVVFVESPRSLEDVTMYLDRMLSSISMPRRFIFLDSLSSLMIYNTDTSVREFTHFLINRIRLENIAGVILSIEKKEVEDLVKTLTPMCDEEIRF